jgi:cold-inducible RNA-binding protein
VWFRSTSSLFGTVCQVLLLDFLPDSKNEFLLTKGFVRNSGETMRIFVANLSYQTTEEQLNDLFSEAGQVESATIVTDRDTGRSRGFAFIEMDKDAAAAAIEKLNGIELNGRTINVNEARPRPERKFGGAGGGGGYAGGRGQRREPRW